MSACNRGALREHLMLVLMQHDVTFRLTGEVSTRTQPSHSSVEKQRRDRCVGRAEPGA